MASGKIPTRALPTQSHCHDTLEEDWQSSMCPVSPRLSPGGPTQVSEGKRQGWHPGTAGGEEKAAAPHLVMGK